MIAFRDEGALADAMRRAEAAHKTHEEQLKLHHMEDTMLPWPEWYANFMGLHATVPEAKIASSKGVEVEVVDATTVMGIVDEGVIEGEYLGPDDGIRGQ